MHAFINSDITSNTDSEKQLEMIEQYHKDVAILRRRYLYTVDACNLEGPLLEALHAKII